ncbi:MAG: ComEA family DNA-binding protein [bacterium]
MYAIVFVIVVGLLSMDGPNHTAQWTAAELAANRARDVPLKPPKPVQKDAQTPEPEPRPVDLNTATAEELDTLPGVGPSTAARIIAYREKRRFKHPKDIMRVRGIGKATFAKMKDRITVEVTENKRQKRPQE